MDKIKELSSKKGKSPKDILDKINGISDSTSDEREDLLKPRNTKNKDKDRDEIKSNLLNRKNNAEIYARKTGRKIENDGSEDIGDMKSTDLESLDFDDLEGENDDSLDDKNTVSDENETANGDQTDEKKTTDKEKNDEKSDKNEGKSKITFIQSAVLICIAGGIFATLGISAIKSVSNWDFKKTSVDFVENAGILMGMDITPTENKAKDYIDYVIEESKNSSLVESYYEVDYKYNKKENKMSFTIDETFITITPDIDIHTPKKKGKAKVLYVTNESGDLVRYELIEILK